MVIETLDARAVRRRDNGRIVGDPKGFSVIYDANFVFVDVGGFDCEDNDGPLDSPDATPIGWSATAASVIRSRFV